MKKILACMAVIILSGLLSVTACQTDNSVTHTPIPIKEDVLQERETPDDILPVPGGGPAYRANVHQEGIEIPLPAIEVSEAYLGTGTDEAHIYYRSHIDTAHGETRNNIIKAIIPDKDVNSLSLYADNVPQGITLTDGMQWSGPSAGVSVLVIEISTDISSGEYPLEIGLEINGKNYGTITCIISVISQSIETINLNHAKPYLVIGEGNLVNDNPNRSVALWYITSEEASSFEERAQTAIRAAIDLYSLYENTFTSVLLIPQDGIEIAYAQASFAIDGKGASGMTGSVPAESGYWKIRATDRTLTEQELAIAELWFAKQQDFPQKNPLSSLSYDEQALRQYIADTLNISYDEAQMPHLEIREYELDQSLVDLTAFLAAHRIPGHSKTERALGSLRENGNLDNSEKAIVISLVNEVSEEIRNQFALKYEAAEEVASDSRWGMYSSWRPYRQSSEYQQLLEFCKGKGKVIWPIVLQQLDSETTYFAGGLILDITIPEYLYYFEDTARQSNLQNAEPDIFAYIRELLVLLQ